MDITANNFHENCGIALDPGSTHSSRGYQDLYVRIWVAGLTSSSHVAVTITVGKHVFFKLCIAVHLEVHLDIVDHK